MDVEFEALRDSQSDRPPFPRRIRRPDWRSSSAKRLAPQLQIKGPTLRRWHSKIAVAVDKPFFASIGGPSDTPSHDLDSGDVIWLVPELSGNRLERGHWEVLTLEASTEKLLSAKAIPRQEFEQALRRKLTPLSESVPKVVSGPDMWSSELVTTPLGGITCLGTGPLGRIINVTADATKAT